MPCPFSPLYISLQPQAICRCISYAYIGTPPFLINLAIDVAPELMTPVAPPLPAAVLGDDGAFFHLMLVHMGQIQPLYLPDKTAKEAYDILQENTVRGADKQTAFLLSLIL